MSFLLLRWIFVSFAVWHVAAFNVLSARTSHQNNAGSASASLTRSPTALNAFRFIKRKARSHAAAEKDDSSTSSTRNSTVSRARNSTDIGMSDELSLQPAVDEDKVEEAIRDEKSATGTRLRKLKDLVWVRETLEDLTAAEFACTVESGSLTGADVKKMRRKRAVDYEKLLAQLNRRISDLGCEFLSDPTRDTSFTCALIDGEGSAAQVYNEEQRQALLERLIQTRKNLIGVIKGYEIDLKDEDAGFELNIPELRVEIPIEKDELSAAGPKLYVREDGTVDWDGALQDQAALRNFGTAVWARINGREPESASNKKNLDGERKSEPKNAVTAQVAETVEIKEARKKLVEFQAELAKLEVKHTALLNSAIGAGQAVANVNLAVLNAELRKQIMESAETLEKTREQVSYHTLLYESERIYTYLAGELGNPDSKGYISLQDRLNIAEFGLLESQTESFKSQFETGESIDGDVLLVVQEQMNDFKRRLGIDYFVTGLTFDREAIVRWLAELLEKTKKTLAFYGKGCRLFWNDVVFTLSLVTRAAQGYTLKPREVRTIRRTFKDILTFIPFVIILLIPLSPVGHVLVFGAIQRFFPDFFPSCFTEQRQNLLRLYETAEYSEFTIDEDWKAKLSRILEAFAFFVANTSRNVYIRLNQLSSNKTSDGKDLPPPNGSKKVDQKGTRQSNQN